VNLQESEAYLLSLGNEIVAMKLWLESIRKLLAALGDPQNKYLKVQVAGTNGKGSVCAFLDSICLTAGVKVGLYTSPHLISITERIWINGEDVSEDDFARLATLVRDTAENLVASRNLSSVPTFFEQVTAIALLAFAEAEVELAILETGLGGSLDATTAANAEICAITRIDLDHQEYLGDTIEEIAAEKAAIIHEGSKVVIGDQRSKAMEIIVYRCNKLGILPIIIRGGNTSGSECALRAYHNFGAPSGRLEFPPSSLGLKGVHQAENAAIAVGLARELRAVFHIPDDAILDGLKNAHHPGRLEYAGRFLFDGAHNIGGAKALAAYLEDFESRPITLVFGAMADKPLAEILELLVPRVERVVLTQPANERSVHYDELLAAMPAGVTKERTFVTDTVAKAIDIAETITPEDGIILVTGSLYLVGEVKRLRQDREAEFEI
jgi:dihydrofolate synthase/folylpolyglutamate synthase